MGWPKRPVLFGDCVADILDVLRAEFGVPALASIPDPRPEGRFIVAQLMGGGEQTDISEVARVNVSCWSDRDDDAHDLAQLACRELMGLVGVRPDGAIVKSVEITGKPAFIPDPDSLQPRFRFTVNVHRTAKDYR